MAIWEFQRGLRFPNKTRNLATKQPGGTARQGLSETTTGRKEWTTKCFRKTRTEPKPQAENAHGLECGKGEAPIPPRRRLIQARSNLLHLNQNYNEQDIAGELERLASGRAHGCDGIPIESHGKKRAWAIKPILRVSGGDKGGQSISLTWENGAIE